MVAIFNRGWPLGCLIARQGAACGHTLQTRSEKRDYQRHCNFRHDLPFFIMSRRQLSALRSIKQTFEFAKRYPGNYNPGNHARHIDRMRLRLAPATLDARDESERRRCLV
jgi:hypothetical protein